MKNPNNCITLHTEKDIEILTHRLVFRVDIRDNIFPRYDKKNSNVESVENLKGNLNPWPHVSRVISQSQLKDKE